MNKKSTIRRQIPERDLYQMEYRLGAALHGVAPRPDFVSSLHNRLVSEPVRARNNALVFQYVILSLAGILSGVILIVAGARAVNSLLSFLGVVQQADRQRVSAA
jgi:hypothetical protein